MIQINYNVNQFDLTLNTNSDLGKKILNLIKNLPEQENMIKIQFNSANSYNLNNINSTSNANIIEFKKKFNAKINLSKYTKLKEVLFGDSFNSSIIWSDSIEKIIFSHFSNFNQILNIYPKKLKYLEFGNNYNQEVNNMSSNIKYLKFGDTFNNLIDNLPNGLEYLLLGQGFNQNLDFLPESLITLNFSVSTFFNKSLDNLPNNLQELSLPINYKNNLDNLPNNIKYLKLSALSNITKLPNAIEKVEINSDFFLKLIKLKNFKIIKELIINDDYFNNNFNNNYFNKNYFNKNFIDKLFEISNEITNIKKINLVLNFPKDLHDFKTSLNDLNNIYKISEKKNNYKNVFILEKKFS